MPIAWVKKLRHTAFEVLADSRCGHPEGLVGFTTATQPQPRTRHREEEITASHMFTNSDKGSLWTAHSVPIASLESSIAVSLPHRMAQSHTARKWQRWGLNQATGQAICKSVWWSASSDQGREEIERGGLESREPELTAGFSHLEPLLSLWPILHLFSA